MPILKEFVPFGKINIPPLSDEDLTSHYENISWHELNKYWKISMYITIPNSDEPIDKPGRNIIYIEREFQLQDFILKILINSI